MMFSDGDFVKVQAYLLGEPIDRVICSSASDRNHRGSGKESFEGFAGDVFGNTVAGNSRNKR